MLTSTRRGISYPNPDRSDRPDIPAHILNLINGLEVDMVYAQGTDAARIARAHLAGTFFYATDTTISWYDDGATWRQIGPLEATVIANGHRTGTLAARPAANAVSAGTLYFAADNGFVYRSDGAAWTLMSSRAGAEYDYKQITASVTGIAVTTEGTAAAVITGNSVNFDGDRVKIEVSVPSSRIDAGVSFTGVILRDGTAIGETFLGANGWGSSSILAPAKGELFDTPSAAAHQYAFKAFVSSGTADAQAGLGGAGAKVPAFLRVTRA
jgi:hypothetical protein